MHNEYGKILLNIVFGTILIVPIIYVITSKRSRRWIKEGIEGDNKRLDMNEIWEMIYMFIAVGCFILLIYMIFNKTLYGTAYSWQEYSLMLIGMAGSNGLSAYIIWLKNKR